MKKCFISLLFLYVLNSCVNHVVEYHRNQPGRGGILNVTYSPFGEPETFEALKHSYMSKTCGKRKYKVVEEGKYKVGEKKYVDTRGNRKNDKNFGESSRSSSVESSRDVYQHRITFKCYRQKRRR